MLIPIQFFGYSKLLVELNAACNRPSYTAYTIWQEAKPDLKYVEMVTLTEKNTGT